MKAALLLLLLITPLPVLAVSDEERVRNLCDAVASYQPGPAASITEQERQLYLGKSRECLHYVYEGGIGRDYSYYRARVCCLSNGSCNRELGMIFANGWDVRRDYDAATWFLCRAGAEMSLAEQRSMLEAVQEMRKSETPKDLQFCEWAANDSSKAWCAQIGLDPVSLGWERRFQAVVRTLDKPNHKALDSLRYWAQAFLDADARLFAAAAREGRLLDSDIPRWKRARTDDFVRNVERFGTRRAPSATLEDFLRADYELETFVRAELDRAAPLSDLLFVAQLAWNTHRVSWVPFYRVRWRGANPLLLDQEILAAITRQRTEDLKALLSRNCLDREKSE